MKQPTSKVKIKRFRQSVPMIPVLRQKRLDIKIVVPSLNYVYSGKPYIAVIAINRNRLVRAMLYDRMSLSLVSNQVGKT